MQTKPPTPQDPAVASPPMADEADIGSGEKTPAQLDTEKIIQEIPPLPAPAGHEHEHEHEQQRHAPDGG